MDQVLISIITPTFNCGPKIERTIQSVLAQQRELFEFLVIDGASTDNTLNLLRRYEPELKLHSETDSGIYWAINCGIDLAQGKYLLFLGAGDCLRDGVLARMEKLLPHEVMTLVYGNVYRTKVKKLYGWDFEKSDFQTNNICQQAIFYERSIFASLGKFDTTYTVFADWAFNMKCFGSPAVIKKYVDVTIADFEEGGMSERQKDPAFERDFPRLIRTYLGAEEYLRYKSSLARRYSESLKRRFFERLGKLSGAPALFSRDAPNGGSQA